MWTQIMRPLIQQQTYSVLGRRFVRCPLKLSQHEARKFWPWYPMMGKHFGNYLCIDGDSVLMIEMNRYNQISMHLIWLISEFFFK